MRSSREPRGLVVALALVLASSACGNDAMMGDDTGPPSEDTCKTSYLTYSNFGQPFSLDWCRGCHSSSIPATMRQKAPLDVNFDTLEDVHKWQQKITVVATGTKPTMPPAGGPSEEERVLLAEWIGCGAQ